ncbi:MAG: arginase family protein [Chloroflexota bacterium]
MKSVRILGVPMDLGQQRRGVDMGPSAVRYAGLHAQIEALGLTAIDHGNLVVPNPEESVASIGNRRLQSVAQVCEQIFEWGVEQIEPESFSLFLGGDHSISIGSVQAAVHNNVAQRQSSWDARGCGDWGGASPTCSSWWPLTSANRKHRADRYSRRGSKRSGKG